MNWNQISIKQFQELNQLAHVTGLSEMEMLYKTVAIVFNLRETQVKELNQSAFMRKANTCATLMNTAMSGNPVHSFISAGKRFSINYDTTKISSEHQTKMLDYTKDFILHLHQILACIVEPVRSVCARLFEKEPRQEKVALQMLNAPFADSFNSVLCVFQSIDDASKLKGDKASSTIPPFDAFINFNGRIASALDMEGHNKIGLN